MRRALDGVYLAAGAVAGLGLIAIAVLVLLSIITRLLGLYVPGLTVYAGYAMATSSFLALAYTFGKGGHIRVALFIEKLSGNTVNYPMIGDPELKIAKLYDMLPAEAGDSSQGRTPADNATVRSVFVIGPDKKVKLILTYPMTTGRNFDEILRALDSIQLTAKHQVATPVQWKHGDDVIITPAVTDEEAEKRFPGFERVLPYMRKTKQPTG